MSELRIALPRLKSLVDGRVVDGVIEQARWRQPNTVARGAAPTEDGHPPLWSDLDHVVENGAPTL
ncbi:hypothetical protein FHR81_002214 [Actinoalloteichus hoggarensis]|uniref:Uncharacterized protein n=1 Tax=Actinoalloteichus hoggarensis TaxID=1470176 RepID=A0A221W6A1_9PSEU|nr:hypothetical protein AHOG_18095 [Actinoalloteichus hoggarensis]MBB5921176.1 hypothetical protein [Actinoalloteichus hoggarensis]